MKRLTTKTTIPIPDLEDNAHTATTPTVKDNMLNKFFIAQSQQSVTNCDDTTPTINTTPNITFPLTNLVTTTAEVEMQLTSLDTSKAPGTDGIPTRIFERSC